MESYRNVSAEPEDSDKPPSIESEDESETERNLPDSAVEQANRSPTSQVEEATEIVQEKKSSASDFLKSNSSTSDIFEKDSSTNSELIQASVIGMNANDSRRSDEYLKEETSEIFIGKADLNMTEGALSLDELEDNQVRLSWRANIKKSPASAFVIESKTKSGIWRQVCRVSAEQTEVVLRVEEEDQLKFRIREAEAKEDVSRVEAGQRMTTTPSPLPSSTSEEIALPKWKQKLIDKKIGLKKQKDEEEEMARKKWSELPEWKRKLLETKGKSKEDISNQREEEDSCEASSETNGSEIDSCDDTASEKSAGFWGVKLKKQKSRVKSSDVDEESEESKSGNYKDGAKRLWGVSLKVTEKGESATEADTDGNEADE